MKKFSIIIPVYNVDKYIADCLDSILKQSYDNYEVILVNDGSTDNSLKVCSEYAKKNKCIKCYDQENKGVSEARNFAISKASGEYMVFIDSDDMIKEDLLKNISKEIEKNPGIDLIKYQLQTIDKDNNIKVAHNNIFDNLNGQEAFLKLIENNLFVTPVTYIYRRDYWIENKFQFAKGRIHEDFGLIPKVVLKASSVSSIDYVGYNYILRDNSIMTNNSSTKLIKKNEDMLFHYDSLLEWVNNEENIKEDVKKVFRSYISNALIDRCILLDNELFNNYLEELKKREIGKYLLNDTFFRKMKKLLFNISPKLYINLFVK